MSVPAQPEPFEMQRTGVPVDFHDPNDPHFPGDLETQAPSRPFLSKKARWITAASGILVLSIVTAILVDGKLGMNSAKRPVPAPVYSTLAADTRTVYMTPIEILTTVVTQTTTSNATTTTATSTPSPSSSSFSAPVPAPTLESGDDTGRHNANCFTKGEDYASRSECEAKCSSISSGPGTSAKCSTFSFKHTISCLVCKNV
ncbi:hypothetical protein DE146DRAFT_279634 [Phaeosphaeria sp. MPI-PUGE-AT-0046c]|nr:hypothetical protein DE146DRAFT_279634 [Phaeosphaeria sp. MPI-PUGE-AT-0046c]